jgi:hypothetical protein
MFKILFSKNSVQSYNYTDYNHNILHNNVFTSTGPGGSGGGDKKKLLLIAVLIGIYLQCKVKYR